MIINVAISIGISVIFNLSSLDLDIKRYLFGVLRLLGGYFANLYNLSVVLGNLFVVYCLIYFAKNSVLFQINLNKRLRYVVLVKEF